MSWRPRLRCPFQAGLLLAHCLASSEQSSDSARCKAELACGSIGWKEALQQHPAEGVSWRAGSILMSQPITVTPKILRPALPMAPSGFARGRGGFPSPGFPGGRGAPFAPPSTGRGRGRMDRPLSSHKYVRPEFKAQLDRQKAGIGPPAP